MRAIVNVNPRWGIGNENRLLVHIRSDMRRFRAMTSGNTIIIGRKTLDTFPDWKPLKNRENIILTRDTDFRVENAVIAHDLSELNAVLFNRDPETVFVCGGEQIYRLLLPYCTEALVTLTYCSENADRFFPDLNRMPNWVLRDVGEKQYEDEIAFRYLSYVNTDVLTF